MDTLAAQARAWREDHQGWTAAKMRLWKRKPLQQFFGAQKPVLFEDSPDKAETLGRPRMIWASKAQDEDAGTIKVEDGFLRSRGLGAELIPPLSLVLDDLGIYYDPARPSRLEKWIEARATLRPDQQARAERLITALTQAGLSKYNLGNPPPTLQDTTKSKRILVPGQVEDDASIKLGTDSVRTNLELLQAVRKANPEADILYKPHPDVEAGLRAGAVEAEAIADHVLTQTDPALLLAQVDEVWTMTSLLGFEALLRGVPVTTLGTPFYAGWGLTQDLGDVPPRRRAEPGLAGLVHAALIDYPRYFDPKTGQPCPVEVIVDRLAQSDIPTPGPANRVLSKLQGLFASQAHLWRRG